MLLILESVLDTEIKIKEKEVQELDSKDIKLVAGGLSDGDARVANCDSDRGHAPVGCDPPGLQ